MVGGLIRSDTHFPLSSSLFSFCDAPLSFTGMVFFCYFVCRGFGRIYIFIDSLLDLLVSTFLFSLFFLFTMLSTHLRYLQQTLITSQSLYLSIPGNVLLVAALLYFFISFFYHLSCVVLCCVLNLLMYFRCCFFG